MKQKRKNHCQNDTASEIWCAR